MAFSQSVTDTMDKYELEGHDTVPTDPAYTVQHAASKDQSAFPVFETAVGIALLITLVLLALIYRKLSSASHRS